MAKLEISELDGGKFSFLLKSRNGKKLLVSSSFNSLQDCRKGVDELRILAADKVNFRMQKTGDCEPYLIIGNRTVIAQSEIYASIANLRESIPSIQRNLNKAVVLITPGMRH